MAGEMELTELTLSGRDTNLDIAFSQRHGSYGSHVSWSRHGQRRQVLGLRWPSVQQCLAF